MAIHKIEHRKDVFLTESQAREKLPACRVQVLWFTNKENAQSVVHSHPYHELVLPVSGSEVRYSVGGSLYSLTLGELIYFPPGLYHAGYYTLRAEVSERLVLQIDDTIWQEALRGAGGGAPDWAGRLTMLDADSCFAWDIRGLMERMAQTAKAAPAQRDAIFTAQLAELQLLISMLLHDRAAPPHITSKLVAQAVAYLQNNYQDPELTVARLARAHFVSREYLSRTFKEYTMESVHEYLTALRMQHCRRALAAGVSVLDACNESGFSNYSSFLKTFRSMYGVTPAAYRAAQRAGRGDGG